MGHKEQNEEGVMSVESVGDDGSVSVDDESRYACEQINPRVLVINQTAH